MVISSYLNMKEYQRLLMVQVVFANFAAFLFATSTIYQIYPYPVYLSHYPQSLIPYQMMLVFSAIGLCIALLSYSFLHNFVVCSQITCPCFSDWRTSLLFSKLFVLCLTFSAFVLSFFLIFTGLEMDMSFTQAKVLEMDPRMSYVFSRHNFFIPHISCAMLILLIVDSLGMLLLLVLCVLVLGM
ncbi:unnamed protein product [Caenorhabditis auriculariae]|uniref:Uncharacterized protein n=1 Tax=Caenorhabditis auriculariae TaxID=2777116 RepID=A0A8S1H8S8_9PELO|nr:unnamed protein product [Caenorhabditis auriculariae]